jgi:hypothetical protein
MTDVKPISPHSAMMQMTMSACEWLSRNCCVGRCRRRNVSLAMPNWGLKTNVARMPVAAADAT